VLSNTTQTHRGIVFAKHGVAAASQPLAVSAALEILHQGGTAIDAAIVASAVLTVVEPSASHIGGDAFVIMHDGRNRTNLAFNGSGEAPHQATADKYPSGIDLHGYKSATVPGLVSTWFSVHEQNGKLPIERLLERAIDYAENGYPLTNRSRRIASTHKSNHPELSVLTDLGINDDLDLGDLVKQPDLAWTLKQIATYGRDAFYHGEIAERIIAGTDGWFSKSDLANHSTRVLEPLSIKYRDYLIYGQPPPSQGMIFLEALKIAEGFNLGNLSTSELTHILVEAKKIGFADRYRTLADPETNEVSLAQIFDDEHINRCRAAIDLKKANNESAVHVSEGKDTTYFLVADSYGNAVSWIQSVFYGFGSSFVVPSTGILLNNRLTGFSLDPTSVNFIQPGKRPAHTLNAWLATNLDGSLKYVGGTPGGNIQVQTNLQLLVNLIDLGMNVQQSCEAPRWQHLSEPSNPNSFETFVGSLEIENRFDDETIAELETLGHSVKQLPAYGHGSAVQLLEVLPNGTYAAGSDPRVDGQASGY
jgi:gamma-glutamyltranspeptidase/glutathione hydrolase